MTARKRPFIGARVRFVPHSAVLTLPCPSDVATEEVVKAFAGCGSGENFVFALDEMFGAVAADGNAENGSLRDADGVGELPDRPDGFAGNAGNVGAALLPAIGCV